MAPASPDTTGTPPMDLTTGLLTVVQKGCNELLLKQVADINTEADKTIAVLDKCELMVNARKISDDMDRARLAQALRATIR